MLYQIANHLGITQALGYGKNAILALWLIMARLIEQGSRLAAVRLAQNHAVAEILNLNAFNEDDLYKTLDWLYEHKVSCSPRYCEICQYLYIPTYSLKGSFVL